MYPLADAKDVAAICGVPEGGAVAEGGLGCEEEFEGNVGGGGRIAEEVAGVVAWAVLGAEHTGCALHVLVCEVVVDDLVAGWWLIVIFPSTPPSWCWGLCCRGGCVELLFEGGFVGLGVGGEVSNWYYSGAMMLDESSAWFLY